MKFDFEPGVTVNIIYLFCKSNDLVEPKMAKKRFFVKMTKLVLKKTS